MFDPTFNNFDPKDLYDPRDPNLYNFTSKYPELLRQTLAAKIHQIWCPDAQRDHLIRAEQVIAEFLQWQLVAQSLKKGGPTKGKQV